MHDMRSTLVLLLLLLPLAACDQINNRLGIEDPAKKEARLDAEGRAVGGACRQSGRAIEDCYSIYSWLPKSSVFAGWRDMDTYMRENKLETVEPQLPPPEPPGKKRKKTVEPDEDTPAEKPTGKTDKTEKLDKPEKSAEKTTEKVEKEPTKNEAPAEKNAAKR